MVFSQTPYSQRHCQDFSLGIAFDILFDHSYIKGDDLIYDKVSYAGVTEFVIRLIILGWTI